MPTQHSTAKRQIDAHVTLTRFVAEQTDRTSDDFGLDWIGRPEAPVTHLRLRAAVVPSTLGRDFGVLTELRRIS